MAYYKLSKFTLKEIDKYLWQLGKEYYNKRKEEEEVIMLGAIIGDIAGSNMSSTIRLIMISRCSAKDATSPMIPSVRWR